MRSLPGRVSVAETVTGVCILVALVILGGAVIGRGLLYETPALSTISPDTSAAMAAHESPIPAPTGFRPASPVEAYSADTLYEKINGKADMYLESGFRSLVCQRFVSEKDESSWLEGFVYDLGAPVNAFGVYGQQRRSGAKELDIAPFAYQTVDGVYAAAGPIYIEIQGSVATEELAAAMAEVAGALAGASQADDTMAVAMAMFPKEGQVAGSAALYPVDAFGCALMTNVYTMRYDVGDRIVMAFASPRESIEAAEKLAEGYAKFIVDNGGKEIAVTSGFAGRAFGLYGTTEVVFARGSVMGGVHGADDAEAAMAVAQRLRDNLSDEPMALPAAESQPENGDYYDEE